MKAIHIGAVTMIDKLLLVIEGPGIYGRDISWHDSPDSMGSYLIELEKSGGNKTECKVGCYKLVEESNIKLDIFSGT